MKNCKWLIVRKSTDGLDFSKAVGGSRNLMLRKSLIVGVIRFFLFLVRNEHNMCIPNCHLVVQRENGERKCGRIKEYETVV